MPTFTIKSRLHGDQTFFVPPGGGYVRLERGTAHGTLGQQICYGGDFCGSTVTATPETLEREARRWWRARLTWLRA